METYDSRVDTQKHIDRVAELLQIVANEFLLRGRLHDASKLESPEKEYFDKYTPMLRDCEYGSDEYKQFLTEMKPALDHHYSNNSHHPEFYPGGIDDMDLLDVLEMLMDFKAAGERHSSGNIYKSLEINTKRFNISPQLYNILRNTAVRMWGE